MTLQTEYILQGMLKKYGLSDTADFGDVLFEILNQDKYLKLAYAMEQTRGDWSEGFYRVEHALTGFVSTTPEDILIVEELQDCMENYGEDGRIFRDCTYNYDILYNKVPEILFEDFQIVREKLNR